MIGAYLNSILLFSVFTALSNFFIGFLVLVKNRKGATNVVFFIFSLLVTLWSITNYFSLFQEDFVNTLLWVRIVLCNAALMFTALYLLTVVFPGSDLTNIKRPHVLLVGFGIIVAVVSLSPYVFSSINISSVNGSTMNFQPVAGPLLPLYALAVLGFPILSILTLTKKYRKASGVVREQFKWFLAGVVITFFLTSLTNFVLVNFLKEASFVVLGPFFTMFLVGSLAYTILRHRFLDIRIIVIRTVAFFIFLALLAVVYAVILYDVFERITGIEVGTTLFIAIIALTVFAMLTFQSFQSAIRRLTDRFLFKGIYDHEALLSRLTHIMSNNLDIDLLTGQVIKVLIKEMRISKAAFLIINRHKITDVKGVGYQDHKLASFEVERIFHKFYGYPFFVFEDISDPELKELFRKLDISVLIPIRVEGEEIAFLALGAKLSGEIYYQGDVDLLDTFASEAGIAIQNAKNYSELQALTKGLEKRVLQRTEELEESQKKELAKAQEVARLKDEFVFFATHELRTPITAIRGFLELISYGAERFPRDLKNNFHAIVQASNHMNTLVDDLLEIARSEAGTLGIQTAPVDFVPVINGVLEETAPLIKEKLIKLTVYVPKSMNVLCDAGKLEEVLENLVSNAIKYNKEGGSISVSAFIIPDEKRLFVEVRDSGYGIPKDKQDRVFGKFFRALTRNTSGVIGTGLGLFITKMLIEKMGGEMAFSSVEGAGSTFTFTLQLAE